MNARRLIVWATSLVFGLISTIGIILIFGTTLEKFTPANAVLVFLSSGGIAFIWLDYLLRTQYLRS
ncbi:MAG: hypothetical protein ACK2T2_04875 [Anaerolineales bacterium]|jgi:hypothetical protein